jgi:hypothetical protein
MHSERPFLVKHWPLWYRLFCSLQNNTMPRERTIHVAYVFDQAYAERSAMLYIQTHNALATLHMPP